MAFCAITWSTAVQAEELQVLIRSVHEGTITGSLIRFSLNDGALLRSDAATELHVPTRDIVRISNAAAPDPKQTPDHFLTMIGGDFIGGRVLKTEDDSIFIESPDVGTIAVPIEAVVELALTSDENPIRLNAPAQTGAGRMLREDRVILSNGDVIRGFIAAISPEKVAVDVNGTVTDVPMALVVSVQFVSSKPPVLPKAYASLMAGAHLRLTCTDLRWVEGAIEAHLRVGGILKVDPARVRSVDLFGGRWEWLSEHQPVSAVQTPMLSVDWPMRKDLNVRGGLISVAGELFRHGIGVHSRSHLTFELQHAYKELVTSFGIDDDSGPLADVAVSIHVDGRNRFERSEVRRGRLHGPVRLDITNARRIELIVDFGKNGDMQDRFNWVEPALIRE